MKKGNKQSGDPRKRQAVKDIEIRKVLAKRKDEQRGLEIGEHEKSWGRMSYAAAANTFPSL